MDDFCEDILAQGKVDYIFLCVISLFGIVRKWMIKQGQVCSYKSHLPLFEIIYFLTALISPSGL